MVMSPRRPPPSPHHPAGAKAPPDIDNGIGQSDPASRTGDGDYLPAIASPLLPRTDEGAPLSWDAALNLSFGPLTGREWLELDLWAFQQLSRRDYAAFCRLWTHHGVPVEAWIAHHPVVVTTYPNRDQVKIPYRYSTE